MTLTSWLNNPGRASGNISSAMISNRQLFLQHIAQTSDFPIGLEVESAEGVFLYDRQGKAFYDMIAGISVSNLGHRHPRVLQAIRDQLDKHMHLMVYGEYIQTPQVRLAEALARQLPGQLNCTYFVNSGSEATEGALKLAKRYTGRFEIVSFRNAYHGSTQGALSIMGDEEYRNAFRPLLPGIRQLEYNNISHLERISDKTACVILEPIQAEAGVVLPEEGFLQAVRERCSETGALLIFDEIQTGFGRTGPLFAFMDYRVEPDILLLAKSLGGGLPLGAFISSREIMSVYRKKPALGHITTFGGHPVSCAAGLAAFQELLDSELTATVGRKEQLFREKLVHPTVLEIRGKGLMLAIQLRNSAAVKRVIPDLIEAGIIMDWFIFCDTALRLAPPLIITEKQIGEVCDRMIRVMDQTLSKRAGRKK